MNCLFPEGCLEMGIVMKPIVFRPIRGGGNPPNSCTRIPCGPLKGRTGARDQFWRRTEIPKKLRVTAGSAVAAERGLWPVVLSGEIV
jgi:hypothetical protein